MSIGPVEYIAIGFPGSRFSGEIIPALKDLVDRGIIRVLDLIVIHKDASGDVEAVELNDTGPEERGLLDTLGVAGDRLLGVEDVEDIGAILEPGSTAALMLWENIWAARFAESLRNADGILLANGRIPVALIEEAMSESATA
jgi:hypothetical protein